jgi:hypothetical protein
MIENHLSPTIEGGRPQSGSSFAFLISVVGKLTDRLSFLPELNRYNSPLAETGDSQWVN